MQALDAWTPLSLIAALTLVTVALHTPGSPGAFVVALAVVALLRPTLLTSAPYWGAIAGLRLVGHLPAEWHVIDNHQYLLTYLTIALALALRGPDPLRTLRVSARWLLVGAFTFATLWKLLSPDFLDGTFFAWTLQVDERFGQVTERLGETRVGPALEAGVALETVTDPLVREPSVVLPQGGDVLPVGRWAAWWTLAIEAAVALAFAVPRRRWSRAVSTAVLLAFVATTYAIAPVIGFAWTLAVLGLAESPVERGGERAAYVVAFAFAPLLPSVAGLLLSWEPGTLWMVAGAAGLASLLGAPRWSRGLALGAGAVSVGMILEMAGAAWVAPLGAASGFAVLALLPDTLGPTVRVPALATVAALAVVALLMVAQPGLIGPEVWRVLGLSGAALITVTMAKADAAGTSCRAGTAEG